MPFEKTIADVRAFHDAFGHPNPRIPTMLTPERVKARGDWMAEEVQEFRDAHDIVGQADACIDVIYFAVGTLVELGIDPSPLWDIVQRANMAKLFEDGKPRYREDGKTIKPPGWKAPEPQLHAEVDRQIAAATGVSWVAGEPGA